MDVLILALVIVSIVLGVVNLVAVRAGSHDTGLSMQELESIRMAAAAGNGDIRQDLSVQRTELSQTLAHQDAARTQAQTRFREDVERQLDEFAQRNALALEKIQAAVGERLQVSLSESRDRTTKVLQELAERNAVSHRELQQVLREELEKLRAGNEAKLEKMRETVDEKLQGTLEKRLGDSFAIVSQRLEEVHKGLGEMQNLASDVGGLKRVLTNVKNRGGWGEVQLSRQLEDFLTREQYAENIIIKEHSQESVEFAVKMPGRDPEGSEVYLPIDSKFPQEDYERLLEAQELGDRAAIDASAKALERAVVEQAKKISDKYISPPRSTDFAIMYLPTEGLFAEVVRRPGLASRLQNDHRVLITGPTTLMSLLNSLQLGFRTLAIEKRSSEVWQILGAAKAEFRKYGDVWEKLGKQLATTQRTVEEAGRRTRAVERRLRTIETTEIESADTDVNDILALPGGEDSNDE